MPDRTERPNESVFAKTADDGSAEPPLSVAAETPAPLTATQLQSELLDAQVWAQQQYESGQRASLLAIVVKTTGVFFSHLLLKGQLFRGRAGLAKSSSLAQQTYNRYALLYSMSLQKK